MAQQIPAEFWPWLRNRSRLFLAFFWVTGLVVGLLFYMFASDELSLLMRRVAYAPVSIVGLLLPILIPFLFSAFAVIYHTSIWIPLIAAGKAFLCMFVSIGLLNSIDGAGWLIRLLLMDCLTLPALYLFWLRCMAGDKGSKILSALLLFAGMWLSVCVYSRFTVHVLAELGNL